MATGSWTDTSPRGIYKPAMNEKEGTTTSGAWKNFDTSLSNIHNKLWRDNIINVKSDYGAAGDGSTDDTTAIQDAIDGAEAAVINSVCFPIVYFPAGDYVISSGITWKSAHLIGDYPNNSVRITWEGSAGGTAITKSASAVGGLAFYLISGINFRSGTNECGTYLEIPAGTNALGRMRDLHLGSCSGDAITFAGYINVYMENIQWDGVKGWAINATCNQFSAQFTLNGFSYGHDVASGADGAFLFNNSDDLSNVGPITLKGGRIEVNQAWSGNQAIIELQESSPAGGNTFGIHLEDIFYYDLASMANDTLIYRNAGGTTDLVPNVICINVRSSGLAALIGGDLPSAFAIPSVPADGIIDFFKVAGGPLLISSDEGIDIRMDDASRTVLSERYSSDSDYRFKIRADGRLYWGDGAGTEHAQLFASSQSLTHKGDYFYFGYQANAQNVGIKTKTTEKTGLSGGTVTWSSAIPAGTQVIGISARVTTLVEGCTSIDIGDGTDADIFIDGMAVALNTTADLADCNDGSLLPKTYKSATNIVLTAVGDGASFSAGAIRLTVHYIELTPPTS